MARPSTRGCWPNICLTTSSSSIPTQATEPSSSTPASSSPLRPLPDLRVGGPDRQDRLRVIGGQRELQLLQRTPLPVAGRLAPGHPAQASKDVRRKRRRALVRDRRQQEVQQRLMAVCAHPQPPLPGKIRRSTHYPPTRGALR